MSGVAKPITQTKTESLTNWKSSSTIRITLAPAEGLPTICWRSENGILVKGGASGKNRAAKAVLDFVRAFDKERNRHEH